MAVDRLNLCLTPAAQSDLEAIWLYSAETWSPNQADRYLDGLARSMETLCELPEIARLHPEFAPSVRIHPSAKHLIIYRHESDDLIVLRVLAARQDWQVMLGEA